MKSKTKTELSKMTKKSLLLHIENMQLMIENDHLENQKANREMQQIVAKYKNVAPSKPEVSIRKVQKAAGKMRYQLFHHAFSSDDDRKKVMKIVDNFMDKVL